MIAKLGGQLGNQMFIYASIKSVAIESENDFNYFYGEIDFKNSFDEIHGNTITGIFKLEDDELLSEVPQNHMKHIEKNHLNGKSDYNENLFCLPNDVILEGLFQSPQYFEKYKKDVKKWFTFKDDIYAKSSSIIKTIRFKYPSHRLIFIHCRQGNDYKKLGFAIGMGYYKRAIAKYNALNNGTKTVYVLAGDKIPKIIYKYLHNESFEVINGSLADDLCCLTQCDGGIIANSTFSWWAAYLQENPFVIIRPSTYFAYGKYIAPYDIFPEGMVSVYAWRGFSSFIYGRLYLFLVTMSRILLSPLRKKIYIPQGISKLYFELLGMKINK
jgi:hypothetical protein